MLNVIFLTSSVTGTWLGDVVHLTVFVLVKYLLILFVSSLDVRDRSLLAVELGHCGGFPAWLGAKTDCNDPSLSSVSRSARSYCLKGL